MSAELIEIDYVQNSPDNSRGQHRHEHHESLLIRSGTYRAEMDGGTVVAPPGSLLTWPAGTVHRPCYRVDGTLQLIMCVWRGPCSGPAGPILLDDAGGRLSFLMDWLWSLQPVRTEADADHVATIFGLWVAEFGRQVAAGSAERQGNQRIEHVQIYLIQNLHRAIDLDEVARTILCSKEHLIRQFKQATGVTPYAFLQHQRLLRAQHLLRSTNQGVQAIAEAVGFRSASQLHSLIKRETGRTPGQWRSA